MTRFIAHRGDPVRYRENTIPAFIQGEQNGADMIELDVQLSRDGQCVILHDDTLHRLWNVDAAVMDLTYDEIRHLTSANEYEIPLLEDVIRAVTVPLMIDVKYKESIDPIVDILRKTDAVNRALMVGGNIDAHRRVRELLPDVATGLSWDDAARPSLELLRELRFHYFNPSFTRVIEKSHNPQSFGPEIITEMHEHGFKVSVWTVDDENLMWNLVQSGVDVIITNRSREMTEEYRTRLSQQ